MEKTQRDLQERKLNVALIGNGKMAKEIELLAPSKNVSIYSKIDLRYMALDEVEKKLQDVDVCIDFTHPEAVLNNVKTLSNFKKNIVVGTTGWAHHLPEINEIVKKHQIGLLYSPNFSIGVLLFLDLIRKAAALFSDFDHYDVSGFEAHHKEKVDIPSGTAHEIGKILLEEIERKTTLSFQEPHANKESQISFPSLRSGSIPGTHAVYFDSFADTISLTHTARNRSGFAEGALLAAKWLSGKDGLYTLSDLLTMDKNENF